MSKRQNKKQQTQKLMSKCQNVKTTNRKPNVKTSKQQKKKHKN